MGSAAGFRSAPWRDEGFSLLELLVVIFIIGLMSSVVVMTLPGGRSDADKAADDLALAFGRASREAVMLGDPIRWRHLPNGDTFDRFRLGEWVGVGAGNRQYSRLRLPEQVRVQSKLDDYALAARSPEGLAETNYPTVIFFPTGEATAALVELSTIEATREVRVNDDGRVEVLAVSDD